MSTKAPRLVEVFWRDSAFHRGWSSLSAKREEMSVARCRTSGYLVESNNNVVKVAHSFDEDNENVADAIAIPREAITRMRRLK